MRLEEVLNKGFYDLNNEEREALLINYKAITGIQLCSTCTGSFIKAYNELKQMAKKLNTPAESTNTGCKYEFKPGFEASQVQIAGLSFVINSENLSDAIVEEHLINHPLIQLKNA